MKRHTLRGRVEPNSVKRLIVDDGRLTHAMKVDEFHVWASMNSSTGFASLRFCITSHGSVYS